jgi:hypothetical protein
MPFSVIPAWCVSEEREGSEKKNKTKQNPLLPRTLRQRYIMKESESF